MHKFSDSKSASHSRYVSMDMQVNAKIDYSLFVCISSYDSSSTPLSS